MGKKRKVYRTEWSQNHRFVEMAKEVGFPNAFALHRELGMKFQTVLQNVFNDRNHLSLYVLTLFGKKFPNVNLRYIMYGEPYERFISPYKKLYEEKVSAYQELEEEVTQLKKIEGLQEMRIKQLEELLANGGTKTG